MQSVGRPGGRASWIAVALRALGAAALLLFGWHARATEVEGTATLVSDYVFRGVSQSDGRPAAQVGVQVGVGGGVYLLAWGSSVRYADVPAARSEIDYGIGWSRALGEDWSVDVCVSRYEYPGARELAYAEAFGTLEWRERVWLALGWSPDAFASGESAGYGQVGVRVPLGERWRIEGALGRYRLEDVLGAGYTHASLGVVWTPDDRYELRVIGHRTDAAARRLFPQVAGSRLEVALDIGF